MTTYSLFLAASDQPPDDGSNWIVARSVDDAIPAIRGCVPDRIVIGEGVGHFLKDLSDWIVEHVPQTIPSELSYR